MLEMGYVGLALLVSFIIAAVRIEELRIYD
jgi:hypothetical protein